jgi:hypothetical protein
MWLQLRLCAPLLLCASVACSASPDAARVADLESRVATLESQAVPSAVLERASRATYTPGLGEIMGLNQVRHEKLWFAGASENWPLASYELDEIQEGLGDAIRYNPTHEGVPEPLATLIPRYTSGPMDELHRAVAAKDRASFEKAFDALTAGCNACHQASSFGFNVVQRPASVPFTNQRYTPLRK